MRRIDSRNIKWAMGIFVLCLFVTAFGRQELKRSDQEIPIVYTDDLSLLDHMGQMDCHYAYRDGRVYYRRYHKDSFEEAAVGAYYNPAAGTKKEMVCIDAKGEKTVLFADHGYGDFYLIGERFYMTEKVANQDFVYSNVYSVDMQGQNRIDYGYGEIYAFDEDRSVLILKMQSEDTWAKTYSALDCVSGDMMTLIVDSGDYSTGYLTYGVYHDGWCYFDAHQSGSDICRVVAVSLEGEQKEIMTLTSDAETTDSRGYWEDICEMEIFGDRIYIVFGGYDGTARCFQGGKIVTAKLNGSDCREVTCYDDAYYVCHNDGRALVYFPHHRIEDNREYETEVWDVKANIIYPSDFPRQIIFNQQTHSVLPYKEHIASRPLCVLEEDEEINVYALPDDSGRILRVAMGIDKMVAQREEADYVNYQHFYYADGFLYFEVEFNSYDEDQSIGWRDAYRRLRTDMYRIKLEEKTAELLYSY